MASYKKCRTCNRKKDLSEFSLREISKDGYRNSCKLCLYEKNKLYVQNNKEMINKRTKEWCKNNKEKLKENVKEFHLKNPEYRKRYQLNNKDKINERNKNRRKFDVHFKLKENIRNLIKNSIKFYGGKKNTKTVQILGCTNEEFKLYLESKFEPWMNWYNYGNPKDGVLELNKTWDIDHMIPLSSSKSKEDLIKLNHYTNLQPLCSYNNRIIKRHR